MTDHRPAVLQSADPIALDLSHIVHPMAVFSQGNASNVTLFARGDGIRLYDLKGAEYIDALSGLLNVNIGYGRTELAEVAKAAMEELSFGTLFYGRGSRPAAALANKLADITPGAINRFFFTLG